MSTRSNDTLSGLVASRKEDFWRLSDKYGSITWSRKEHQNQGQAKTRTMNVSKLH